MSVLQTHVRYSLLLITFLLSSRLYATEAAQSDSQIREDAIRIWNEMNAKIREDKGKKFEYPCPKIIVRVHPYNPIAESTELAHGWVLIGFKVNSSGKAADSYVIDASLDQNYEAEALNTVAKFAYRPVVNDGIPATSDWAERIDFIPENGEILENWPDPRDYVPSECKYY